MCTCNNQSLIKALKKEFLPVSRAELFSTGGAKHT